MTTEITPLDEIPGRPGAVRPFLALLRRDLLVTRRELGVFLAQVILQPLFLLFIFGRIIVHVGYADPAYVSVLFPGIVAMATVITGLQTTSFSLVIDFSYTREIEDRLLAPLATTMVAAEKLLFASLRGLIAGLVMFPLGWLVLGTVPFSVATVAEVGAFLVLGSVVGSAIGLTVGTLVPTNRINVVFALLLTPLIFTGCSEYPWPTLDFIRWFQLVTLLNPLTYVSEALRAVMVPGTPHLDLRICVVLLLAFLTVLSAVGTAGFVRKAAE